MSCLKGSVLFSISIMVFLFGCTSDSEKKMSHLEKGKTYFQHGEYRDAENEFIQALSIDPNLADAIECLAETYLKLGNTTRAFETYTTLREIEPANSAARLKLARFHVLGQDLSHARKEINGLLEYEPENIDALYLLAEIQEKEDDYDATESVYRNILKIDGRQSRAYIGLAKLMNRKGDPRETERLLLNAVNVSSASIAPRMALFNHLVNTRQYDRAEKLLLQTIDIHPDNTDLLMVLANFFFMRNRHVDAEATFKNAMEIEPENFKTYLNAARFYETAGKNELAFLMYNRALEIQPKNNRLKNSVARFYIRNQRIGDAEALIAETLAEQPNYLPALMLSGQLHILKNEFATAVEIFDGLLKLEPRSDRVRYFKALAHFKNGDIEAAKLSAMETLKLKPFNINAKLLLAQVYLKEGNFDLAQKLNGEVVQILNRYFKIRLVLQGDELGRPPVNRGIDSFESLIRLASENPAGFLKMDMIKKLYAKYDLVMENFEKSLSVKPGRLDVLTNIILLHAAKNDFEKAINRCDEHMQLVAGAPESLAAIHSLKGGLYLAKGDYRLAEQSFQAALRENPDLLQPYYSLAKIYLIQKNADKAIAQYLALLEKEPQQTGPHMLLGTLYGMQKQIELAEQHYRTALHINSDFAPAANNLAYLLSENEQKIDEALDLALRAREKLPDDPFISDTLGWIYYKKGMVDLAIAHLEESVEEIPQYATVHFHLGMAYYKKGDHAEAKARLEKALNLSNSFNQANEAARILSELN